LASVHRDWIETALRKGKLEREGQWTESVAVGSLGYVEQIRRELGNRGRYRVIGQLADSHVLRETAEDYGYDSRCKMASLSRESAPP
jgi:REP-associated tyrosine transposase